MKTAEDIAMDINEVYIMNEDMDIEDYEKIKSVLTTWKEDICKKQRDVNEKTKDAIQFILENPDQNRYMSDNIEHFMTAGEPDDNSIESANEWEEQYNIVVAFLKSILNAPEPT